MLFGVILAMAAAAADSGPNSHRLEEALQLYELMPACGSSCLITAINNSTCAIGDLDCSCGNPHIVDQAQMCVLEHCTIKQALTTKNISATICNEPVRNRQYTIHYGIAGFVVATAAYTLRILPKALDCAFNKHIVVHFWWDDVAITVSMLTAIPAIVLAILITDAGLGKDLWTVEFHNITRLLKLNLCGSITYIVGLGSVKVSLLLTYLRFFSDPLFTRCVFGAIVVNLCFVLSVIMVLIFACDPPSYYWHGWDGEHIGHCINLNAAAWAVAVINILLDIVVIIMPMPQLWKLQLSKRQKFCLTLMFSGGTFASVVSILRLRGILRYADSKNLSWDDVPASYWSRLE